MDAYNIAGMIYPGVILLRVPAPDGDFPLATMLCMSIVRRWSGD